MWASVQRETPSREPDYSSIEQLFCLPVTEHKDKGAAAPVKEAKEVCLVNTRRCSEQTRLIIKADESECLSHVFLFYR